MSPSTGSYVKRCDCALSFQDVKSMEIHIKETGHMKAKWCTECSRLLGSKAGLAQHKATNTKHKTNAASSTATTTGVATMATTSATKNGTTKAVATTGTADTAVITPKNNPKSISKTKASDDKPKAATKPPVASTKSLGKSINKPAVTTTAVDQEPYRKNKEKKLSKGSKAVTSSTSRTMQNPTTAGPASQMPTPTVPEDPFSIQYSWSSSKQTSGLLNSLTPCCHSEACLIAENYYTGTWTGRKWKHINTKWFIPTPERVKGVVKRKALVMDCEMVGIAGGRSELARICVMDLFTREVLIDSLVLPTQNVTDWRTKYSGITRAMITQAKARGNALDGWPAARSKLFEIADADTILIGHSLNHDLQVIHIIHHKVVDSAIVVAEAVFGKGNKLGRQWGLKTLCQELLGIKIQASKSGHDCMEDTLASRELLLWCFREREKLEVWAKDALAKYETEKKKREERQKAKAQEMVLKKLRESGKGRETGRIGAGYYHDDPSDDSLVMSWEEYLEACEFPPGYDP
ncbi:ribonuclease H-like domain-containing protein [Daldinia sp. FL1419]|nr:ribonuclease H-like domain-containing protein [Daldinia sp. FL1419]